MKFLETILQEINLSISDKLIPESLSKQFLGVAQSVKRTRGDKDTVWPAAYEKGEAVYAGVDEDFAVIIYHKMLAMASVIVPGGYGDKIGNVKATLRCSMVFFANLKKLKLSKDVLALSLNASFPDSLTGEQKPENIKILNIIVNDIVLNEEQVFNEEYKNVPYFLDPEHTLLKVNYSIESTFSKNCFNIECPK